MPDDGKSGGGKAGDAGPIEKTPDASETLGEALSKAGFEPAKIERRIVSQGKRGETLKKRAIKKPG